MSTDHQKYSTENQADAIRHYAASRGIEIVRTYADDGKSGLSIDGRASLQRLIADVESGVADFQMILVYDVSRWGRFMLHRLPPFRRLSGGAEQCDHPADRGRVAAYAPKGVYSPGPRDDAQDARNRLFGLLSEIPGKASYSAIKELIEDHPDPNYRPWMAKRAYQRAEQDGDLEAWTAEQVCAFHMSQTLIPLTHRQLFDLAVGRVLDLKNWLERGNDSPWQTWQRAAGETEMRTLVAGWLNQRCRDQYTTAQEPELANSQRMDIWLHNTNVTSPVPIELKLLDKGWTGPQLCERLRNQLVGDYLREETAGCGIMLLVWLGNQTEKHWMIDGQREEVSSLTGALKRYWQSIANDFVGIQAIDVIVIDLTIRGRTSNL